MSNSLRRFGIDPDPQTFEELQEAFSKVCVLLMGFVESPDLVVGNKSVRMKLSAQSNSMTVPTENTTASNVGFCSIFRDGGDWFIRGGVVTGGPDSHQVDDFQFSVATDTDYLVWLELDVTANMADDVLLPGLESSTGAAFGTGASYPSADIPEAPTGTGQAIIPLGRMVIEDGVPTFSPAGNCSPIQVGHCPGSLTYD